MYFVSIFLLNVFYCLSLISEQGDISTNLQEVTVPILSNNECRKTGYGASRITDNMLCAGFKDGQKDSCQVGHFYIHRMIG